MTGKARGGLGRGLAALIPTGPDTTTVADVLINGAPASGASTPPLALVGARRGSRSTAADPRPATGNTLTVSRARHSRNVDAINHDRARDTSTSRSTTSAATRATRGRCSTRTPWPS